MIGLESALSIVQKTMIDSSLMTWETLVERMSIAPARIAGYFDHGRAIAAGVSAHITVIDPSRNWRVDRDLVASRSKNTPFHGMELPGCVVATFFRGIPTVVDSKLVQLSGSGSE